MTRIPLLAGLLILSSAALAETADTAQSLAQPCAACHGQKGQGGMGAYPHLAGLGETYLKRQLDAFASGQRDNPIMKPMASGLSDAQRATLARYFSKQSPAAPGSNPPADNGAGAELVRHGRWQDDIPACVQCHGPDARGIGKDFPGLAGQPAGYLQDQLKAWRNGKRQGDPQGLMSAVAKRLDDADLAAVADYLASLSAAPGQEGQP
ncbi:cytochrome C [Alcanivorax hongdengensis A-11-3]|uniref:Cytochrome C n=1 Tax=Alcanivorax hongdengensis A-11-3 TaxID=1177179 RepID=L0WG51_9GAMM|nr:c-type cytochrome [Alcanivorax hongdengensis]EKF75694.1 cytochrome C [Alcanivorax hongdengensis A-11-3]